MSEARVNQRTRVGQRLAAVCIWVCAHNTSVFSESIRPLALLTNIWERDNCRECENILASGRLWIGTETQWMFHGCMTSLWPQERRGKRVTVKVSCCPSESFSHKLCYWEYQKTCRKRHRVLTDISRFKAWIGNCWFAGHIQHCQGISSGPSEK